MTTNIVYGLKDPRDGKYRYIGQSTTGILRPKQHLIQSENNNINRWVKELELINKFPIIDAIEECQEEATLFIRERYWIKYYKAEGHPLVNIHQLKDKDGFDFASDVSETIIFLRKKAGLSQETLADKAGVGLRFIRELEQGKQTCQLNKVNQVLQLFGYSLYPCRDKSMKSIYEL